MPLLLLLLLSPIHMQIAFSFGNWDRKSTENSDVVFCDNASVGVTMSQFTNIPEAFEGWRHPRW